MPSRGVLVDKREWHTGLKLGNVKGIVVLQSLKVLHLSVIPYRFYGSPKLKKWICELSTFSQIQSHIYVT